MSVITVYRAAACRATAAAMIPIGPAPVTSTSSPSSGNDSAVCTAFPKGSKIAATSNGIVSAVPPDIRHRQRDVFRERARPVHPHAHRVRAQVPPPRQAVPAPPANHVPFAAHQIAREEIHDVRAGLHDPPTNSCPTAIGTGIVFCAHSSHL